MIPATRHCTSSVWALARSCRFAAAVVASLLSGFGTAGGFGCGNDAPILRPIIDSPPAGSTAYPYDGVEVLSLSIARSGDELPLQEASIAIGDKLALPETPFGRDLVVHIKGLLSDVEISYGRTCPVEVANGDVAIEPHLYLSRIVRWGPGGQPFEGRRNGALAYALPDGSALFAGGDSEGRSVERFAPLSGQYQPLGIALTPRSGATLAALDDGRALIIGGMTTEQEPAEIIEVLDPLGAPERQRAEIAGLALEEHAAATLVGGEILVTGGQHRLSQSEPFAVTQTGWLLRFGTGDVLDPPAELPVAMTAARAGHSMTRLGDDIGADILIVGGRDDADQPVASSEFYRPLRESFEPIVGGDLAIPRWRHAAVRMPGGFVLVLGGLKMGPSGPEPVTEMELYDPSQNLFTPAGTLPESAGLTGQSVSPLPDGRVLIAGGRDQNGQPVSAAFVVRLDPVDGVVDVVATDSLSTPRANHSAVRLCDGTILLMGGSDTPAGQTAERYNPVSEGRR